MFITKRSLIITGIIIAIVMLSLGVGVAYAFTALGQQSATNASLSATATAGVVATPKKGVPNGEHRVLGLVQSLGNQSFVVSVNQGKKTVMVAVNAQTQYMHNGKTAVFSDLQVGETVGVMGTYDAKTSTLQATRVVIAPKLPVPKSTPTVSPTAAATP